ncbi:MAG: hypothetical protein H8E12_14715 [Rhodobacteraceae bacterium]|nr:hypothetical protein [Paracoccaceae bacterium]
MRIIALQTIVDEGMADLAKKVPMFGSGIADSLKLMNKLADENGLDEQQLFSMDKKDLGSALDELRAVSDNVEKFTLKKVNNKVAVSEFAILLLKNNYFTAT